MIILYILALLPPLFLLIYIYRQDKVEREPVSLIIKTVIFGALSVIPVLIIEIFLGMGINFLFSSGSLVGIFLENYIGVALVEEFFKRQACKLSVWNNKEFNYTFDGIVYAVSAAIGFAAVENIMYVNGFETLSTVLIRGVTAIPAHAIFGIYMGVHLGMAKYHKKRGHKKACKRQMRLSLLIPFLLHGFYDFVCSIQSYTATAIFIIFIIILDVVTIIKVRNFEKKDKRIMISYEEF